jgi:uncharacterized RmlC-like cupin family protein
MEYAQEIVTVRSPAEAKSKQRLPYYVGISGATAGSRHLSLNLLVVPPGGAAEPHIHQGYETAIYQIQGRVETRYGEGLKKSVITEAGDFLFIPPDLPHQPVNLSDTEPAIGLVARNDPNEQESVVTVRVGGPRAG